MIYICIPARDEEQTIGLLLWKIRKVMREFQRDYHVMVLDDGSTDGTSDTLRRYARSLPLTVFREETPVGYHGAMARLLREAVRAAKYPKRDSVVMLQADFTESPEYIVPLVKTLEGGSDIVAGTITGDQSYPRNLRWTRRMAGLVMGGGMRAAPVSDPLCGFRAYRIIVLKKAIRAAGTAPLLDAAGWGANVQLLSVVAPHARRIDEVPLHLQLDVRARETRFKPLQTLRDLYRVRGRKVWAEVEVEA